MASAVDVAMAFLRERPGDLDVIVDGAVRVLNLSTATKLRQAIIERAEKERIQLEDRAPERPWSAPVRATYWNLRDLFPRCEVRLEEASRGCYTVSHGGRSVSFHESWWPLDAGELYARDHELGLHATPDEFRKQLEVVERVAKERPLP